MKSHQSGLVKKMSSRKGMVFTIEPGIYTNKFGARSEDTIALTGGKRKILTS